MTLIGAGLVGLAVARRSGARGREVRAADANPGVIEPIAGVGAIEVSGTIEQELSMGDAR